MAYRHLKVQSRFAKEPFSLTDLNQIPEATFQQFPPKHDSRLVVNPESELYSTIEMKKRDGLTRYISHPNKRLREFQKEVLVGFLSRADLVHESAYAYVRGRSSVQCAEVHREAKWILKVDIEDFFHSIDNSQVLWELQRRGVSKERAKNLAHLLTRSFETFEGRKPARAGLKRFQTQHRFLPQGSPTSGAISNLVLFDFDEEMARHAKAFGLTYSRYSDDLIFSSPNKFERPAAEKALQRIIKSMKVLGFRPNQSKTRIIPPGARLQVLGVLVGGGRLRLPKIERKRVDTHLWAIDKFGFHEHRKKIGSQSEYSLLNSINGYLTWAHSVDPEWAGPRQESLVALARKQLGEVTES